MPDLELEGLLKRLKLADIRENCDDLVSEAIETNEGYRDFLKRIFRYEIEGRDRRISNKLIKAAGFDYYKTLEEIEYNFNPNLNRQKIKELGTLGFIRKKENIIIVGPPGVGKTMIATGLGINACNQGIRVKFWNAKEMMDDLYDAARKGTLLSTLEKLDKIPLLIIDELSYLKMDKEKESIFFQLIRRRYERCSLIITTNLPLGQWDEVFTGQIAATAILDRLIHHCHVLNITGDSFRVKGNDFLESKGVTIL
ncbi:MAG: IS21-like element helper ATPase IstB [Eubacteriales bacterium]|nr:IS21-like element helper ATPase IstB [Eubacteriales bacterium]